MKSQVIAAKQIHSLGSSATLIILLLPFVIIIFSSMVLLLPAAPLAAISTTIEDRQIMGLLTAAFLIAGGLLGLWTVFQLKKRKEGLFLVCFYLMFSVGLFFVSIEEMSWVQQTFNVEAVSGLENSNQQEEAVIKNVQIWRNSLEIFPLMFGLVGLLGVWITNMCPRCKFSSPLVLWSWFAVIAVISAIDLFHDFYIFFPAFDDLTNSLEEVTELLVGISCFLFIWLNTKRFRFNE